MYPIGEPEYVPSLESFYLHTSFVASSVRMCEVPDIVVWVFPEVVQDPPWKFHFHTQLSNNPLYLYTLHIQDQNITQIRKVSENLFVYQKVCYYWFNNMDLCDTSMQHILKEHAKWFRISAILPITRQHA